MLLPYLNADLTEAGCDEAGRGCLAGAVYAAAVILPKDFRNDLLNDSKQLTGHQRYALREVIEREAVAWAVGVVSPQEIDEINILNASFLAMHRAIDQLIVRPQHLLIDGNRFRKYPDIPHTTVVKGDGKYLSIAAGTAIRAIPRKSIVPPLPSMARRPIIVCRSTCWVTASFHWIYFDSLSVACVQMAVKRRIRILHLRTVLYYLLIFTVCRYSCADEIGRACVDRFED